VYEFYLASCMNIIFNELPYTISSLSLAYHLSKFYCRLMSVACHHHHHQQQQQQQRRMCSELNMMFIQQAKWNIHGIFITYYFYY